MNELLTLYAPTIVAGICAAIALALMGCQIAARDKAMQTLCLGQGSMLGVLLGITMIDLSHEQSELVGHAAPFAGAVGVAILVTLCGEIITARKSASKNSYFTAFFACLLAFNYLVSAAFPALESHMAQVFFGDLATLTGFDVAFTTVVGALVAMVMAIGSLRLTNHSFELATFGAEHRLSFGRFNRIASVVMLLFLCMSIQFLGFLFTIACLFIPTTILSLKPNPGLRRHLLIVALLAAVSSGVGFLISLNNPRLPTVPTIVAVMVILGAGINALMAWLPSLWSNQRIV